MEFKRWWMWGGTCILLARPSIHCRDVVAVGKGQSCRKSGAHACRLQGFLLQTWISSAQYGCSCCHSPSRQLGAGCSHVTMLSSI
jgi:hypothetical protein